VLYESHRRPIARAQGNRALNVITSSNDNDTLSSEGNNKRAGRSGNIPGGDIR